jgi:hypothetical protein
MEPATAYLFVALFSYIITKDIGELCVITDVLSRLDDIENKLRRSL